MLRQYRDIEVGEFFLVGGDCSQGGGDYNAAAFLSQTHLDVPIVYHAQGVAATMTSALYPVLERLFEITKIPPVIALEQNNGGISEMERLAVLNRFNKYRLYEMPSIGKVERAESTGKYGYNTNTATRPILLGMWKEAYDNHVAGLYDEPTLKEHRSFIINKSGKPEAETGAHDDLVFAHAIAWQLHQTEKPVTPVNSSITREKNVQAKNKWQIG